jgi:hypothetical protein
LRHDLLPPKPAAKTQTPVEIGRANILDQRRRVERQRDLIAKLERDGSHDFVADPVRILGQMQQALTQMEAHHAVALSAIDHGGCAHAAAEPTRHAMPTIENPAMISSVLSR